MRTSTAALPSPPFMSLTVQRTQYSRAIDQVRLITLVLAATIELSPKSQE